MNRRREKRFDVAIFGRDLENFKKWRKIFDVTKQTDEAIQEFYDRICENDKLSDDRRRKIKSYPMDDFEEFLSDTHVYQADYDSLLMKIEEFEKDDRFKPDFFQREAEPITDRTELTTNLVEITEYPETLYIGDQVEGATQQVAFKLRPFTVPTWFKLNKVYSLLPPEEMPKSVQTVHRPGYRRGGRIPVLGRSRTEKCRYRETTDPCRCPLRGRRSWLHRNTLPEQLPPLLPTRRPRGGGPERGRATG